MNIAAELMNKLTDQEYSLVSYYINKASEAYDSERYSIARSSLEDAVAILISKEEYNAAGKVRYYLRFC